MLNELRNKLIQALATKIDDDIIYGCDPNALRWHTTQINLKLNHSRHKWIPQFLWKRIIKGIVIY